MRGRVPQVWLRPAAAGIATLGLLGCNGQETSETGPAPSAPVEITVTSDAFADGQPIPGRFTCDGADVSPPLSWDAVPQDAAATALVVDDPDAPDGTFVHWVVLDIPLSTRSAAAAEVPEGGTEATNSADTASYTGPCPPSGTHHYRFTLYALSERTGLPEGAALEEALDAVDAVAVARGGLVGTYARSD